MHVDTVDYLQELQVQRLWHQHEAGLPVSGVAAACAATELLLLWLVRPLVLLLRQGALLIVLLCGRRLLQGKPKRQLPAVVQAATKHAAIPEHIHHVVTRMTKCKQLYAPRHVGYPNYPTEACRLLMNTFLTQAAGEDDAVAAAPWTPL